MAACEPRASRRRLPSPPPPRPPPASAGGRTGADCGSRRPRLMPRRSPLGAPAPCQTPPSPPARRQARLLPRRRGAPPQHQRGADQRRRRVEGRAVHAADAHSRALVRRNRHDVHRAGGGGRRQHLRAGGRAGGWVDGVGREREEKRGTGERGLGEGSATACPRARPFAPRRPVQPARRAPFVPLSARTSIKSSSAGGRTPSAPSAAAPASA